MDPCQVQGTTQNWMSDRQMGGAPGVRAPGETVPRLALVTRGKEARRSQMRRQMVLQLYDSRGHCKTERALLPWQP